MRYSQKIVVARNKYGRAALDGCREYRLVAGVPELDWGRQARPWNDHATIEDCLQQAMCGRANAELGRQHAADLVDNDLWYDQFVFGNDESKDVGAEATSGKRGNKNVRVETDSSHDTSLKTSSSV